MSDLSFQEAASELGISEGELEKLVADGEISAVKDGDSLTFKRSAIDSYKSSGGEAHILLSDEELDLLGDDDDVDFGIEVDGSESEATPAAASSGADEIELSLDDDLPEIDLGGDEIELDLGGGGGDDTVLDLEDVLGSDSEATTPIPGGGLGGGGLGDDTLLDTDILDLGEEDADTFELDTTEDTLLDPTEEGMLLRGGGARVMQMKRRKSHAPWTAVLAIGGLLMLVPLAVLLSTVYIEAIDVGKLEDDPGQVSHEWIKEYGGYFRGMVDSLTDLFEKKS